MIMGKEVGPHYIQEAILLIEVAGAMKNIDIVRIKDVHIYQREKQKDKNFKEKWSNCVKIYISGVIGRVGNMNSNYTLLIVLIIMEEIKLYLKEKVIDLQTKWKFFRYMKNVVELDYIQPLIEVAIVLFSLFFFFSFSFQIHCNTQIL